MMMPAAVTPPAVEPPVSAKPVAEPAPAPEIPQKPQVQATPSATSESYKIPKGLGKPSPRWNDTSITFADDYDRVAYLLGGSGKSKSHDKFVESLRRAGLDPAQAIARGAEMRKSMKTSQLNEDGTISPPSRGQPVPQASSAGVSPSKQTVKEGAPAPVRPRRG
jgi:hypothetical protein